MNIISQNGKTAPGIKNLMTDTVSHLPIVKKKENETIPEDVDYMPDLKPGSSIYVSETQIVYYLSEQLEWVPSKRLKPEERYGVNADWAEEDPSSLSFIRNKPVGDEIVPVITLIGNEGVMYDILKYTYDENGDQVIHANIDDQNGDNYYRYNLLPTDPISLNILQNQDIPSLSMSISLSQQHFFSGHLTKTTNLEHFSNQKLIDKKYKILKEWVYNIEISNEGISKVLNYPWVTLQYGTYEETFNYGSDGNQYTKIEHFAFVNFGFKYADIISNPSNIERNCYVVGYDLAYPIKIDSFHLPQVELTERAKDLISFSQYSDRYYIDTLFSRQDFKNPTVTNDLLHWSDYAIYGDTSMIGGRDEKPVLRNVIPLSTTVQYPSENQQIFISSLPNNTKGFIFINDNTPMVFIDEPQGLTGYYYSDRDKCLKESLSVFIKDVDHIAHLFRGNRSTIFIIDQNNKVYAIEKRQYYGYELTEVLNFYDNILLKYQTFYPEVKIKDIHLEVKNIFYASGNIAPLFSIYCYQLDSSYNKDYSTEKYFLAKYNYELEYLCEGEFRKPEQFRFVQELDADQTIKQYLLFNNHDSYNQKIIKIDYENPENPIIEIAVNDSTDFLHFYTSTNTNTISYDLTTKRYYFYSADNYSSTSTLNRFDLPEDFTLDEGYNEEISQTESYQPQQFLGSRIIKTENYIDYIELFYACTINNYQSGILRCYVEFNSNENKVIKVYKQVSKPYSDNISYQEHTFFPTISEKGLYMFTQQPAGGRWRNTDLVLMMPEATTLDYQINKNQKMIKQIISGQPKT